MFQSIAKHFRRQKPVADPVLSRQQLSERIDTLSAEIEARGLTLPAPAEYPASTTSSTMPPTRAALLERVEQLESVLAGQSDSTSRPAGSSLPEPRAAMAERIKRLEKKLRAANVAIPPKASEQETRVQLATRLAELEDLAGLVDLREEKQNRIEQLERSIAELKSKKARQQSAAKPAVSSVQPAAGASSATPWHQWTKAERTAEATRLLSLVREDPEIAALNRQATNVTEGATARQKLVDCLEAMPANERFSFTSRFREAFETIRSVGPREATPEPPPAQHRGAMTAAELLALPPSAQASLADQALGRDSGRAARVELKRAYAAASPAQQAAMRGPFGKALDAHAGEAI